MYFVKAGIRYTTFAFRLFTFLHIYIYIISRIKIGTSENLVLDIKNLHFY